MLEIKARVQSLMQSLEGLDAKVYIPRHDRDYAIEVGMRMLILRHLVVEEHGSFQAAPQEHALLRYYANSISHFFTEGKP